MEVYHTQEFIEKENLTPGEIYRINILTEDKAKDLGGLFGAIPPGCGGEVHYHEKRESILIIISGEAVEIVEGEEVPIKAGDVLFIPPQEKHTIVNRSDKDLRFLEFFTYPPAPADFIVVK